MSLKLRIEADIKSAMLSREQFIVETLRTVKGVILNEEVAKGVRDAGLDDASIESLLAKEVKKRHEAAELFEKGGNSESAKKELKEAELLQAYLPKQLSEEEIKSVIDSVISETGASSAGQMGQVIGGVKAKVGNQADGALVARLVKQMLAQD